MIALLDYGMGNLFSVSSSLKYVGAEVKITADPEIINKADRILLPGVGAFRDASNLLKESGLDKVIKDQVEKGKPLMGICLGMQLLFEESYEYGEYKGLGLLPGKVLPMKGNIDASLKVPHMGWNELLLKQEHPVFKDIKSEDCVYFVHSYYADTLPSCQIAVTDYSIPVTAAAGKGNVLGCQFHPEKSGETGLKIVKAFCEWDGIVK